MLFSPVDGLPVEELPLFTNFCKELTRNERFGLVVASAPPLPLDGILLGCMLADLLISLLKKSNGSSLDVRLFLPIDSSSASLFLFWPPDGDVFCWLLELALLLVCFDFESFIFDDDAFRLCLGSRWVFIEPPPPFWDGLGGICVGFWEADVLLLLLLWFTVVVEVDSSSDISMSEISLLSNFSNTYSSSFFFIVWTLLPNTR